VPRVLDRVAGPADLRALDAGDLAALAGEIRDLLVHTVARTSGHLGPNLGVVELTIALHRVFDSPTEPILFDVGHQAYVHKILTGRAGRFDTLRQAGGISGYPNRAESEHDWIENSHASTALSYADGLAKAFAVRGERRPVVAVVGDGALTGGMCWEALNNIAAADRPVIVVVNDNGRSYDSTAGGLASRMTRLRVSRSYEQALGTVRRTIGGTPLYRALHGVKRGMKDALLPDGMFDDLGLKYIGPVDGHDVRALETALHAARDFGGPVIVHAVTRKGYGYPPAERNADDQMHQSPPFDPGTGAPLGAPSRKWTAIFADELERIAASRSDVVAVTAAMREPTGLAGFAARYPDRCFDVGIAEQHAITSAAGLAMAGLHPVVAIYATFLNRAFDQLLMDVALHRLPVTIVLDRAGVTGPDGPSHHGIWDLAMLGVVPGLRIAAPRDEVTLRAELNEAIGWADGPTVLRFPKSAPPEPIPGLRQVGGVDVLAEPDDGAVDVLMVAVGAVADLALEAAAHVRDAGSTVRVVDPRWVDPAPQGLIELASQAGLVVTVEDGVVTGGVGSRIRQALRAAGVGTACREIGLPRQFLPHGTVGEVRALAELTAQDVGRRVVEWAASAVPDEPAAHSTWAVASADELRR
jgi:1-deoxy-D-xylulose-5-phosphate synthase